MALSKKQLEQLKSLLAKQKRDAEQAKKQAGTSTAPLFPAIGNPDHPRGPHLIEMTNDDWMRGGDRPMGPADGEDDS